MDVNGVTTGSMPAVHVNRGGSPDRPATAAPSNAEEVKKSSREHALPDRGELEKIQKERAKLVLKPTVVPVEERLKQVLSLDDVKKLLHLYIPYRIPLAGRMNDLYHASEARKAGSGSGSHLNIVG